MDNFHGQFRAVNLREQLLPDTFEWTIEYLIDKTDMSLSAEVIGSGPKSGSFLKMLESLEENMKMITGKEEPLKKSLLVGDTGYFSEANLQEAAENSRERIKRKFIRKDEEKDKQSGVP